MSLSYFCCSPQEYELNVKCCSCDCTAFTQCKQQQKNYLKKNWLLHTYITHKTVRVLFGSE